MIEFTTGFLLGALIFFVLGGVIGYWSFNSVLKGLGYVLKRSDAPGKKFVLKRFNIQDMNE